MALFGALPGMLTGPVGENLTNDPQDIKTVQRHLGRLGYFKDDAASDFITRALDEGIKNFQTDHDLRVDGILRPGGETERRLFERIAGGSADNVFGSKGGADRHVGFGGDVSGTFAGADAPSTPPPRPEKKPRTLSNTDLFSHYMKGSKEKVLITPSEIIASPTFRESIKENQSRFEDSIVKGAVRQKDGTIKPTVFHDQILKLKDGESIYLDRQGEGTGDYWDRDIERFEGMLKYGDPEQSFGSGQVKIRSQGRLKAERHGDKVFVTGDVLHKINDIYDFNKKDRWLSPFRAQVRRGANPFLLHGGRAEKVTGVLTIKNGKIKDHSFEWLSGAQDHNDERVE